MLYFILCLFVFYLLLIRYDNIHAALSEKNANERRFQQAKEEAELRRQEEQKKIREKDPLYVDVQKK